ncbi:WLM domain-containing protein [Trametes meyenii]|nr:WLM domain-containing protein [Trametes meyenii]
MVHVRLNEKESNPNPHINFITPLPIDDPATVEESKQLLRALAAQVRPVMKAEGLAVNSFEEYQHNQVFAGRNWNNGEVVELVLRNPGGTFLSTSWLLNVLCHELAHIKHMNHGPAFQAYWNKLGSDVRRLQSQGYYGDGYWSSGTRLADSARVGGGGADAFGLPEYMCGGAQSRARPTSLRRRRRQTAAGPSNHTGAQTAKRRKAGTRVTTQGTFKGSGRALDEDVSDEGQKKAGAGFRKKAASKRAREERALAAGRRLLALQGKSTTAGVKDESDDDDDDGDYEAAPETDQDRRRVMLDVTDKAELDSLKTSNQRFITDFIFPCSEPAPIPGSSSKLDKASSQDNLEPPGPDVIELFSDDDTPLPSTTSGVQSTSKGGTGASANSGAPNGKQKARSTTSMNTRARTGGQPQDSKVPQPTAEGSKLSYGSLVRNEIRSRRQESLGMSGNGQRLGVPPKNGAQTQSPTRDATPRVGDLLRSTPRDAGRGDAVWACQVCTLMNEAAHLACAACATPRGEAVWAGGSI